MRHLPRAALLAALLVVAGQLAGYDVDVANAVGERLGKKVEFVQTPWDSIFAALEANRFDVVANEVTITRNERVSTTCPSRARPPR
jgi:ABC-type amino acid transport substrate-binding protein